MLVGLVLTENAARVGVEPFFLELIAGMEEALTPHGITVLLLVVPSADAERDTYRRWASDRTVRAVVVVNLVHDDPRPAFVASLGLPAVLAGRSAFDGFSRVVTDDAGALTVAVDLLASLGHRVVGRVTGPADLVHTADRTEAMVAAAGRHDIRVHLVEGDYSASSGVRGIEELLAVVPPPTAVIFDNDVMAVAASRSGIDVPGQVSLLVHDDSPLCELAVPPLAALSIDVHEHGLTLGRVVLAALDGAAPAEHPGPPVRVLRRASISPV
ncbi:LacI family DNA-binding transcriptional regulator [Actinoplanes couchii]|uniref:LacI family transcriptional regulator n=1 Tax=Actinoplanes couchii TaxID=403638 RepID=A0ABQ3XE15_9ACTN|nr:substrate-binding domain-containing protein [Actinoplanes couchii]MDR6317237.1 DNA-binding LacI/PurR family transcriptional regulator [Actinoplanes couchii]GID56729.1 LacI family transcriptional regulator [Actinoplanes couchii]